jgi:hypothetical protein
MKYGYCLKIILIIIAAALAVALAIQLIPYGRTHENPPATTPVQWTDPQAEEIARRACYNCHSNESDWPWYAYVAPASWLVQRDVDEGRRAMNFSTGKGVDAGEISEILGENEMPPAQYLLLHPEARLSQEEKDTLVNGVP